MANPLDSSKKRLQAHESVPPGVKALSRTHLGILVFFNLVTLLIFAAVVAKDGYFSEWQTFQRNYRAILVERATGEAEHSRAAAYEVKIRQIDLPELGINDRCVSCHTGLEDPKSNELPEPYKTHPGDILKYHPPEKYGCTICHAGQGSALTNEDARGEGRFWEYPLLPVKYTQASCGFCHDPEAIAGKGGALLAQGKTLYYERGCAGCHRIGGRGGNAGPLLDSEGKKIAHMLPMAHVTGSHTLWNWLDLHFQDPQGIVSGSLMPDPRLDSGEIQALTVYMLSLQGRSFPREYVARDGVALWSRTLNEEITDPAALYQFYCHSCHGEGSYSRYDKFFRQFVPAIRGQDFRDTAAREFFIATVKEGRPGTRMPSWKKEAGGLSEKQIALLSDFVLGQDASPAPDAETKLPPGDMKRGEFLYEQHCTGCHAPGGAGGLGPQLANPLFQKIATDRFIVATISQGRIDTPMPSFGAREDGLTGQDIRDLVTYIRKFSQGVKHE